MLKKMRLGIHDGTLGDEFGDNEGEAANVAATAAASEEKVKDGDNHEEDVLRRGTELDRRFDEALLMDDATKNPQSPAHEDGQGENGEQQIVTNQEDDDEDAIPSVSI